MEQRWGLPLLAWPPRLRPNTWDLVALPLVLGLLALVAWGGMAMSARYHPGQPLPISLDPWRLPEYALRTVLRMAWALVASLVFSLGLCRARRQEPAGREDPDPGARHPAIGADPRLSVDHRDRFHRALPGPAARRRMRRDLRDLHLAGLEHDVQRLPVAAHRAGRADRGGAHVPPVAVAAVLAARSAACDPVTRLEHDDVGVGRLVLCRRLRGDHRRRPHDPAARHRLLHRDRDRPARTSRRSAGPFWSCSSSILLYDQLLFRPLLAWSRKFQPEAAADEDNVRPVVFDRCCSARASSI